MSVRQHTVIATLSMALVIAVVSSGAAWAQTPEPIQIAANTTTQTTGKPAGEIAPSTATLQARIDAQQQEISRLSALVEKLQASLQPIASSQPVLPTVNAALLTGYMSPPSPSPTPAPTPVVATNSPPRELLPDIGHIGAELGFFVGGATNPYKDNKGFATGGFIDLPWKKVRGGKLSYEIMIGLQRATTTQTSTSGVNVLVNTAIHNYLVAAGVEELPSLTDYLAGPLPALSQTVQERSKVLTVAPFELKYTITKWGKFRPYVVGGLGTYVWIGSDSNVGTFNANTALGSLAGLQVGDTTLGAAVNSLLQGSQIGGLAPTSPELAARGVPHGQGNLLFGAQLGGGFEFRISPRLSWGADFRRNQVEGSNASFNTFTFKQGFHW